MADAKKKLPTAEKRQLQDAKKRLSNTVVKSRCRTAINNLLSDKTEDKTSALKVVYSRIDRAEKAGVFKKNKAARMKSRLTSRVVKG